MMRYLCVAAAMLIPALVLGQTTVVGGGGSATRTWQYATMGLCQNASASAALWLPTTNAPTYTTCDATRQQGEWQIASGATSTNWGLAFRVPQGVVGSYTGTLTWRTTDTTIGHGLTITPSYSCVAAGASPDNPTYTTLSTVTLHPTVSGGTNIESTFSFTPTCAAGSQARLLLTATANTMTAAVNFSYESLSVQATN